MGYLSIIGEENLKNCFSAKQVTVLNNKKTERKLYVVTNKDEFPDKPFKNDLSGNSSFILLRMKLSKK